MKYEESIKIIAENLPITEGSVLITGATGLIGSCIIDVFSFANANLSSNFKIYALGRSLARLKEQFGNKVIPIVQDINEPLDITVDYDFIIHAASNADPKAYAIQPVETVLTNILGNKNVLDYCKEHLSTRLILTSTFEVYGRVDGVDVYTEDMAGTIDFHLLRNGYPESKRCAEILLRSYIDEYGVNGVIARLASIYGPTMLKNDSKAHAQFIRNVLNGENIVLKSKGLQRRTYCYVIDAVSAILMILFKGKCGEAYNVSNEKSIASIAEVAKTCAVLAGTEVIFDLPDQIEAKGFSKPQNCILDNTKLKSLGWSGRYTLVEGLKETIETLK